MCRFQNSIFQQFWWKLIPTQICISVLHPLLSACTCPSSSSPSFLISRHSFLFLRAIIILTLASPRIPFESHIMSNMQLGAHQQLPDSITLTKASVGRSYRASGRPRKGKPKPLAYLHLLMSPRPTSPKFDWGKESPTSLISFFSHVRPPVITSSFYQPSCLSLEFLLQWRHEIRRSAKADPFHGNTREAAVVRLPGGVSKRRGGSAFWSRGNTRLLGEQNRLDAT